MADTAAERSAFYASAGNRLIHFEVAADPAGLTQREAIKLPADVQYAWPHASRRYLYVICSDGGPEASGARHSVCVLRVDPTGALALHGDPVPLRWRPLHVTTDGSSQYLLVAYNRPSMITVHRLEQDGTIGVEVPQSPDLDFGIFAHQVRVTPSGRRVIVVTRGNDPEGGKPEDPGALKLFDFEAGRLANRASVAPGGGYGYGPRHVDFHPTQPWLYVALERQNKLQLHDFSGEEIAADPRSSVGTLADIGNDCMAQKAGAIHVHPNGRFVYVSNRKRAMREVDGQRLFAGGENNIAVFAIDRASGEPALIQNADTHGIAPRTFSIDPGGRLLAAACLMPMLVPSVEGPRRVSAGVTLFVAGQDGKLTFIRKYDIDTGAGQLFWQGFVTLPQ